MSVRAITWAFEQTGLRATVKFVLVALADSASDEGYCFPGQARLGRKCAVTDRAIRTALGELEARGLLERAKRRGAQGRQATDTYRLVMPMPESSSDTSSRNDIPAGQAEDDDSPAGRLRPSRRNDIPAGHRNERARCIYPSEIRQKNRQKRAGARAERVSPDSASASDEERTAMRESLGSLAKRLSERMEGRGGGGVHSGAAIGETACENGREIGGAVCADGRVAADFSSEGAKKGRVDAEEIERCAPGVLGNAGGVGLGVEEGR